MDSPPVPKPRSASVPQHDPLKRPVPLPRTKVPSSSDRVTASDILRSITTVSKQITEDVTIKVTNSAKTANEKFENAIIDGSRFAKGKLEKTLTTSRAVRDSVTKSVIEGTRTAGLKLRRTKKPESTEDGDNQRCNSMPIVDVGLFDNIQFHSPLLEQKRYCNNGDSLQNNQDIPSLSLNTNHFDDLSLFSSNSDSNTDTVSNFSYDSRESEQNNSSLTLNDQMTYDTPKTLHANSIGSLRPAPEVPERRKKRESNMEYMRQNSLYENWTIPNQSSNVNLRPSKSTIYEFDPLNSSSNSTRYDGMSNELLLLESFLIGDIYGTIVTTDNNEDNFVDYGEVDYYNPPTPPERSDSLIPMEVERKPETVPVADRDRNSNWFITDSDTKSVASIEDETKQTHSMKQKFTHMKLKLDNVLHKSSKQNMLPKVDVVERPPLSTLPVTYYSGFLTRIVSGVVEDLFKNSQSRYCVLSDQKLMCYTDPTNSILKEAYTLDSVYSLQIVLPLSSR